MVLNLAELLHQGLGKHLSARSISACDNSPTDFDGSSNDLKIHVRHFQDNNLNVKLGKTWYCIGARFNIDVEWRGGYHLQPPEKMT